MNLLTPIHLIYDLFLSANYGIQSR